MRVIGVYERLNQSFPKEPLTHNTWLHGSRNLSKHMSKTQQKRDMHAVQELGEQLLQLPQHWQSLLDAKAIDSALVSHFTEFNHIHAKEARRRHLQFIGKILRKYDTDLILKTLSQLDIKQKRQAVGQHELQELCVLLLASNNAGFVAATTKFPNIPRQTLQQLLRQSPKYNTGLQPWASQANKYHRKLWQLLVVENRHSVAADEPAQLDG